MMKEVNEKLSKATDEMNECICSSAFGDVESLKTMDPVTLKTVQSYLNFVDAAKEYMRKEAEMIDSINEKLEMLLNQTRTGVR